MSEVFVAIVCTEDHLEDGEFCDWRDCCTPIRFEPEGQGIDLDDWVLSLDDETVFDEKGFDWEGVSNWWVDYAYIERDGEDGEMSYYDEDRVPLTPEKREEYGL
jgi:hypothetical protein